MKSNKLVWDFKLIMMVCKRSMFISILQIGLSMLKLDYGVNTLIPAYLICYYNETNILTLLNAFINI